MKLFQRCMSDGSMASRNHAYIILNPLNPTFIYSRTSIARTPMACLPWLIRTQFWVPTKFFRYPPPHLPHPKKQIPREIFLFYHENVCCMYSSESPHRGNSNEYIQHTIIVKEIKKTLNYRYLLPDLAPWLTLSGSNYLCLDQFSMVPKMFEPLKFDCSKTGVYRGIHYVSYFCSNT